MLQPIVKAKEEFPAWPALGSVEMRINCKLTILVFSRLGHNPKLTDVNGNISTASILAQVLNFCGKI